jgi:uncharacterized protein YkwD
MPLLVWQMLLGLALAVVTSWVAAQQRQQGCPTYYSEFECEVLKLTNAERAVYGLRALRVSRVAYRTAKEQSENMARGVWAFTHQPRGRGPVVRARANGGHRRTHFGENIAVGQRSAGEVVAGWMSSLLHCAAILDERNHSVGIARAMRYTTQVFAAEKVDIRKTGKGRRFHYPSLLARSRCGLGKES